MVRKNGSFVISVLISTIIVGCLSIANVKAQSPTGVELKSVSNGTCMDVYQNKAKAGTPVGTYPCNKLDHAQQFAPNTGALYFQNGLCVGESAGKVVLRNCATSNMNFKFVNGKYTEMAFYFGSNSYVTTSGTTGKFFNQLSVRSVKTIAVNQEYNVISL